MDGANKLRRLLDGPTVLAPGVYDGLSARLAQDAGFDCLYASGGAIARSTGLPDLGLLGVSEVAERIGQIVDATNLPVVADADTGFGNASNTWRTVRALEARGVAALHLEDQEAPKRCGHLDGKSLVPAAQMEAKIQAAVDARRGALMVIARTDAIAVEGAAAALERAERYRAAGADMLFVEAPRTRAEIERIAALGGLQLVNMFEGGKTPLVPLEWLESLGFSLVIVPSDLQRAAIRAMQEVAAVLRRDGTSTAVRDRLATFAERESIVGTEGWLAADARWLQGARAREGSEA